MEESVRANIIFLKFHSLWERYFKRERVAEAEVDWMDFEKQHGFCFCKEVNWNGKNEL